MLSIFNKLFDMKTAGGPMFEQYFRNAVMLTIEDPDTGCTLLDVSKVLANKAFREMKLSHCNNPIVVQFWREVAEKAGGGHDASMALAPSVLFVEEDGVRVANGAGELPAAEVVHLVRDRLGLAADGGAELVGDERSLRHGGPH